jgi:hypothetical protein
MRRIDNIGEGQTTPKGGQILRVFVKNLREQALMPTTPRKARILLKQNKAKIVSYEPFTIQLLYPTGESTQKVNIGIDLGATNTGVAIQSQNKVISVGEIELRRDVKSNLFVRRTYRRTRRLRKTRYRKPRFNNRGSKRKGWLPPSIQSRINSIFRWIDRFCDVLPNPTLIIEVAKFDVQRMMNPDIQGKEYQQGSTYGYYNVRYFVFARDKYTCQVCKKKNKILRAHHIIYRSKGGSNKADNLITVCTDCHTDKNHQKGKMFWKWMEKGKKLPSFQEAPFMNIIRRKVFSKYPDAKIVYGSFTTLIRKELGLEKTHYNDALAISGIKDGFVLPTTMFRIKQVRKKKRSLHEAIPRKGKKNPNRLAIRNNKNTKKIAHNGKEWCLYDKVLLNGEVGFISGFSGRWVYVQNIKGTYIQVNKKYRQLNPNELTLVCRNNNWISTRIHLLG